MRRRLIRVGGKLQQKDTTMKKRLVTILAAFMLLATACSQPADVASRNLSLAADNFEIQRRIVFYNGITDSYMLEVIGLCSINPDGLDNQLEVTCKTGPNQFRKHFLGLSDNVTYFAEQIVDGPVSDDRYRVVFRPQTVLPDPELG